MQLRFNELTQFWKFGWLYPMLVIQAAKFSQSLYQQNGRFHKIGSLYQEVRFFRVCCTGVALIVDTEKLFDSQTEQKSTKPFGSLVAQQASARLQCL